MYSSKTKMLIFRCGQTQYADLRTGGFKPIIDNRYSEKDIATHEKETLDAEPVEDSSQLEVMARDLEVVGIDEIQFFDSGIVDVCDRLRFQGKIVYAAGLDMDYRRRPFMFRDGERNIGDLLAIADNVEKMVARCRARERGQICGAGARYTMRLVDSKELIDVGSEGKYIATCLRHHKIPTSNIAKADFS